MRLETIEFPQGLKPRLFLLQLRRDSSCALLQSQDISFRFATCLSKLHNHFAEFTLHVLKEELVAARCAFSYCANIFPIRV